MSMKPQVVIAILAIGRTISIARLRSKTAIFDRLLGLRSTPIPDTKSEVFSMNR